MPDEKLTPKDIASGVSSVGKESASTILKTVLTSDNNLHMKANIISPYNYSLVHMNSDYLDKIGWGDVAEVDRMMANNCEMFGVSEHGKENRVKQVLDTLKTVLFMEHEEKKGQRNNAIVKH